MSEQKRRLLIRFQPAIADYFDYQAAFEGSMLGTVANRLLREELGKIEAVGIENCFVTGSEEYKKAFPTKRKTKGIYMIPPKATIEKYLPQRNGKTINRQVSFILTERELEILEQVVVIQDIMGTMNNRGICSFRYAVHGLLLNSPILKKQLKT